MALLGFKTFFFYRIHQIRDLSLEDAVIVLVGNKLDLTEQRVVTNEQALELASTNNMQYFETSVKENTNVKQTIEYTIDVISDRMAATIEKDPALIPRGVKPRDTQDTGSGSNSGCAC